MFLELRWLPLLMLGCTDAALYARSNADLRPDRVTLTGQTCTTDPRDSALRVRVLLVVDTAAGPLFAGFDPDLLRLDALDEAMSVHAASGRFAFGIHAMGPRPRRLAPVDGSFTTNPQELEAAVAELAFPVGCEGPRCRDYAASLDLIGSTIASDLASSTAGERHLTEYVAVLVSAGPPDDSAGDIVEVLLERTEQLRTSLQQAGALSFRLHTMLLGSSGPRNRELLQQLAFVGGGRHEAFDLADAITLDRLGLLSFDALLEPKALIVQNLNALPGRERPQRDSDGDGLSDTEEGRLGTRPDLADTDFDGLTDLVELVVNRSPRQPEDLPERCPELTDDDGDGLDACAESLLGTDPTLADTDGDGLDDGLELRFGTNHLRPDLLADDDHDGTPNGVEVSQGTDPRTHDAAGHLGQAYRYSVTDDGLFRQPTVADTRRLTGLTILSSGPDTPAGIGTLSYSATTPPTLAWRGPEATGPGPIILLEGEGPFTLQDASNPEHWLRVDAVLGELPPVDVSEDLLVSSVMRRCWSWTVRNVGLTPGDNRLKVQLAQAPAGRSEQPSTYREALIDVHWDTLLGRLPAAERIEVPDEAFTTMAERP